MIRDIFGEDGLLARALPGYEPRPQQLEMAQAVLEAIELDRPAVVEAGTGTDSRHSRSVNKLFLGVDQSTVGLPGWNRENCAKLCRADAMPVDEIEDLAIAVC